MFVIFKVHLCFRTLVLQLFDLVIKNKIISPPCVVVKILPSQLVKMKKDLNSPKFQKNTLTLEKI